MSFVAPFPGTNVLTATFVGHGEETTASPAGPYTSTINVAFDAADAERWLVIGLGTFGLGGTALTSVTIGGVAATPIIVANPTYGVGIYAAKVPTNATQNVVTTWTGFAPTHVSVALYSMKGVSGILTADNTFTGIGVPITTTFNVAKGGCVIGCSLNESPSHPTNAWSGITKDLDFQFSANQWANSSAHDNFPDGAVGLTISDAVTGATPLTKGSFASFAP